MPHHPSTLFHTTLAALLACTAALAAGCAEEDLDGIDEALLGSWILEDSNGAIELTFNADGTTEQTESGDGQTFTATGTYSADGTVLTMDLTVDPPLQNGVRTHVSLSYYADGERFNPEALLASGAHDGFVGTWTSEISGEFFDADGEVVSSSTDLRVLEIRADNSATLTITSDDITSVFEGEYPEPEADRLEMTLFSQDNPDFGLIFDLALFDDRALLGDTHFTRKN